jgi:hypothetical protein
MDIFHHFIQENKTCPTFNTSIRYLERWSQISIKKLKKSMTPPHKKMIHEIPKE